MLIDSHAHMDRIPLDKIDDVLLRAKNNGVKSIISNGVDIKSNQITLTLSKKYDMINPALGFYPTEKIDDLDSYLKELIKNNPIAIGEVGLEFKEILSNSQNLTSKENIENEKKRQIKNFEQIIHICEKKKLPIITHTRKAEKEAIDILSCSSIKPKKIILHCFSGNFKLINKAKDLGWTFSVPTNIVRNEHFQKLVSETPMSQILTETDTPYLSPFKENQKLIDTTSEFDINEPANIAHSIKKIAQIKKMEKIEIENTIYFNYQKIFL